MNSFKRAVVLLVLTASILDGIEAHPSRSCSVRRQIIRLRGTTRDISSGINELMTMMGDTKDLLEMIKADTQAIRSGQDPVAAGAAILCELDVWSGIDNPSWEIPPSDPLYDVITASAAAIPQSDPSIESTLGYRGFECQFLLQNGTTDTRIFPRGNQTAMELLLLAAGHSVGVIVGRALQLAYTAILELPTPVSAPDNGEPSTPSPVDGTKSPCMKPAYMPGNWNDGGAVQSNNNCYNYATNMETGTFAQPGRASRMQYTELTGTAVAKAAKNDGLTEFAMQPAAGAFPVTNDCLVALVIDKNNDFHWFRQDASGNWSHKPGSTKATNKDNAGNLITDPRTANIAPYTFVKFMGVCPPKVTVNRK